MRRPDILLGAGAAALVAATVLAVPFRPDARAPSAAAASPVAWREVGWSAPFDPWPGGREFRCSGGGCGPELRLSIRPKIGFCNCATGVADDDELDRVGDLDLVADEFGGSAEGRPLAIGGLPGRIRAYRVRRGGRDGEALAIAAAANCNVVVATLSSGGSLPGTARAEGLAFLQRPEMIAWARQAVEN
ncbi:hypothetical protein EAH89_08330 [Roseomonas nepalensis]|uniref:Uncharacterized protein n=1 Tax=Muricoccus nepalensis TaxID=1854500 RepID=A0A502GAD5_9PROT|nr:hypothetical protein EAH89_08330 [Roseomonas nepalensis]